MFTRLLIGLDGSPNADEALEQAVILGARFKARLVVAHVQETDAGRRDSAELLERAHERVKAAGLPVQTVLLRGSPDSELATLARDVDTVLVGRRGRASSRGGDRARIVGKTVASLIRIAERSVIVCASQPSPMERCAVAYDGRATAQRALELVARFASVAHSTVHVIHATIDPAVGTMVIGEAEAVLSLQGVPFVTHIEHGTPGEAVARVIQQERCDALFAGAHVGKRNTVTVSHAEEILLHTDIPVVIQP